MQQRDAKIGTETCQVDSSRRTDGETTCCPPPFYEHHISEQHSDLFLNSVNEIFFLNTSRTISTSHVISFCVLNNIFCIPTIQPDISPSEDVITILNDNPAVIIIKLIKYCMDYVYFTLISRVFFLTRARWTEQQSANVLLISCLFPSLL